MESYHTCLRCVRALTGAVGRQSGRSIVTRSFTRSTTTPDAAKPQRTLPRIQREAVKPPRRLASTAAARAEDPYSRQNTQQSYGDYRAPAILRPDRLFHPFSESPVPEIRQRAMYMKQHAYCPHPAHQQTHVPTSPNDPEARKILGDAAQPPAHVSFECPDCGIATYCCEEHWIHDYEAHLEICDTLRQINEDDHDLRSGRWFPEFEYPGPQLDEILVNMTSWDTLLYTRQFEAINAERSMRQATRLLTYPLTVASILHELSPYSHRSGGRITTEGLKSLSGEYSAGFVECC